MTARMLAAFDASSEAFEPEEIRVVYSPFPRRFPLLPNLSSALPPDARKEVLPYGTGRASPFASLVGVSVFISSPTRTCQLHAAIQCQIYILVEYHSDF